MLTIKNARKVYETSGFKQVALNDVSISFRENEFVAILGPSGSGKTTLLNIIGGLDHYDSGDLLIDGISTKQYKDSDWDTYRNNRIGFIFQSYNLIPHQSVLSNVELALTLSGVSQSERRQRAIDALDEVGLKEHINKKPNQLSGGQMQRVAIARALVNDPAIILADEPTGALDSKTSVQVMDMLTKIAKDRLVIMVTHNNELAEDYANRIVTLKDGEVIDDTNPYEETKGPTGLSAIHKASMSRLTALSLSFSNLMTKKGRTFVTALAGSIGIVGIALILALANGINQYIGDVQKDTLSIYPLSIQETGMSLSNNNNSSEDGNGSTEGSGSENSDSGSSDSSSTVKESSYLGRMFNSQKTNDLKSLKAYIESNDKKIKDSVSAIEYKYDITPQIYLGDTAEKVNPDPLVESSGMGSTGAMSSMMSSLGVSAGMSGYQELPGELDLYSNQYDIVKGKWPTAYDEAVLVLDGRGRISDFQLYEMGLKDRSEFKTILNGLSNQGDSNTKISDSSEQSYDDLMSVNLKVVNGADQYQYNSDYKVWVDKSSDTAYMKNIVDNGISLKIVGIVMPSSTDKVTSLSSGVYYTPQLVTHLMEDAKDKEIVKAQLANPEINVLTNESFSSDTGSQFDFASIISIDESAIQKAFNIDGSKVNIDTSSLDLTSVMNVTPPAIDVNELTETIARNLNIDSAALTRIISRTMVDFMQEEITKGVTDPDQLNADLNEYLARSDVQESLQNQFSQVVDVTQLENAINDTLTSYVQATMATYVAQMSANIQNAIASYSQTMFAELAKQLPSAISINQSEFAKAFKLNMNQDELMTLMNSMMNTQEVSYKSNLKAFGYGELDKPSSINIYPISFSDKEKVTNFITDYNTEMKDSGQEDKVVQYTDLVGTMMSSVTDIVDMVSYALIAFVAISLVVSSIMIGVITYISVLERKKEIGILRAMGASKGNIRQVFNAETIIIGFLAGLIGVVSAALLSIIANIYVSSAFNVDNIAQLPIMAAIILIAISVFLTYIAGLFPAASAARRDPVEALRSE